jgi:hypothetical protein
MTAGCGQRVNCRRLGESVMQDKNGGKVRRQPHSEHGRRWKCGDGVWDVQAVRHESMQVSDACVERALCGRIAVGSCASDGRGRGDVRSSGRREAAPTRLVSKDWSR